MGRKGRPLFVVTVCAGCGRQVHAHVVDRDKPNGRCVPVWHQTPLSEVCPGRGVEQDRVAPYPNPV